MTKKNVTYNDIAKYTGFSKTTVSRYFNNPNSVTSENRAIISDALNTLGYRENKVARILASGKTEFIGIIVPNLYLHFYAKMLDTLLSTYEKYGYKFIVFAGNDNKDEERRYLSELLAYKIEGLIMMSHTIPSSELARCGVPVVGIEREDENICSVNTDNYMGAVQATSLLIRGGCDHLIHINSDIDEKTPAYQRIRGFRDTCVSHGKEHDVILCNFKNSYSEDRAELEQIIDRLEKKYPGRKKGIFTSSDTYANIILNILLRRGKAVPSYYMLIGFDNSPISEEAMIPISTIGQQADIMADEAMSMLSELMEKGSMPAAPEHRIITPILIRRETTD